MSRTLIIAPCTVADAVMAQPLIALLKRFDPARRIDVLAKPSIAPLFRAVAEVSEVIESSHGFGELQPLAKVGLARRLGARRYERAYVLPHKRRAAIAPWLAGIPQRVGIASRWHWGLINCEHRHAGGAPTAERFARLAFAPDQPLPAIPAPVLMRNRERERALRERLGLSDDAMLIVLCPGGDHGPAQRWPARHYAALASMIAAEWPDAAIALTGAAADRALATEIAALSGQRLRNLCGDTTLADTLALLSQSAGIVTNDNGLQHLAAAFGRPQVAIYGATDPRISPPRSARARVEWLHLECSPCFARHCRHGHLNCLNELSPAAVLASLRQAMQFATRA